MDALFVNVPKGEFWHTERVPAEVRARLGARWGTLRAVLYWLSQEPYEAPRNGLSYGLVCGNEVDPTKVITVVYGAEGVKRVFVGKIPPAFRVELRRWATTQDRARAAARRCNGR